MVSTGFPVGNPRFPRGLHSGIWAVSAFHGTETTGKLGVTGMETRWKPRVNPGFPAGFLGMET